MQPWNCCRIDEVLLMYLLLYCDFFCCLVGSGVRVGDLALLLEVLRNLGRVASFVLVCGIFLLTLHKIFGFVHFGLARSADMR